MLGQGNALIHAITGNLSNIEARRSPYASSHTIAKRHTAWQLSQPWVEPKPAVCSCECFSLADALWQTFDEAEKRDWRAAVTAPYMSGYDVWMSEALYLCNQGLNLPDVPGPGGGHSPVNAIPGSTPAPASCLPPPPLIGWRCTRDPDWLCQECPFEEREYDTEAACLADCIEPPPPPYEDPDGGHCGYCTGPTPQYWTLEIPDHTSPHLPAPGLYVLEQNAPNWCNWIEFYEYEGWHFYLTFHVDMRELVVEDTAAGCVLRFIKYGEDYPCRCVLGLPFRPGMSSCPPDGVPAGLVLRTGYQP
jgi:hypothetical protein